MAETIQIQRLRTRALTPTDTFGRGDTLRSPELPGPDLELDDVFSI